MENEIKITKDNYKAYTDLYLKLINTKLTFKEKVLIYGLSCLLPIIIMLIALFMIKNDVFLCITIMPSTIVVTGIGIKMHDYLLKNKYDKIKKMFPNIDTNVDVLELRKALEKVNIIRQEYNCVIEKMESVVDSKGFEKYLNQVEMKSKCEEIKEQLLEENKYDYSNLQYRNDISKKELERTKVKVKTLIKKG